MLSSACNHCLSLSSRPLRVLLLNADTFCSDFLQRIKYSRVNCLLIRMCLMPVCHLHFITFTISLTTTAASKKNTRTAERCAHQSHSHQRVDCRHEVVVAVSYEMLLVRIAFFFMIRVREYLICSFRSGLHCIVSLWHTRITHFSQLFRCDAESVCKPSVRHFGRKW